LQQYSPALRKKAVKARAPYGEPREHRTSHNNPRFRFGLTDTLPHRRQLTRWGYGRWGGVQASPEMEEVLEELELDFSIGLTSAQKVLDAAVDRAAAVAAEAEAAEAAAVHEHAEDAQARASVAAEAQRQLCVHIDPHPPNPPGGERGLRD
jgi:hypothetical protein